MRRELDAAPRVADDSDRPKILVEWWPKPVIAPGRLSWVDDLIARAGGRNPLGGESVKSRPISDDEVRDIDPDAIVLSLVRRALRQVPPRRRLRQPDLASVAAIAGRQVHCVPEAFLGRPSPRLIDGFRALRDVVESARVAAARVPRIRAPHEPRPAVGWQRWPTPSYDASWERPARS